MPLDHTTELAFSDYYMKPTTTAHFTPPPPAMPGLAPGTRVAHDATEHGTGFGWVVPTSTRFPEQPSAFGTAPYKDAVETSRHLHIGRGDNMYQSISRVELRKPKESNASGKVLPHEKHTAGYATAAASSSSRVFGV